MQATIYNLQGEALDTVELNDAIYGIAPNVGVVHQAVLRQQANARLGTHNTRTRADVSGGGKKPWRQKGTGRARQGSTRSPQWRHGGVVFGPHPRSYEQDLPRKMRRLAMRSVLSAKAADGQILLIDSFEPLEPRTKAMVSTLSQLRLADRKILIMTPERQQNVELAAGNLPRVSTMRTDYLSLVDMLKAEILVIDRASLDVIERILGQTGGRTSRPVEAPAREDGAAPRRLVSPLDGESLAIVPAPAGLLELPGSLTTETDLAGAPAPLETLPVETDLAGAPAPLETLPVEVGLAGAPAAVETLPVETDLTDVPAAVETLPVETDLAGAPEVWQPLPVDAALAGAREAPEMTPEVTDLALPVDVIVPAPLEPTAATDAAPAPGPAPDVSQLTIRPTGASAPVEDDEEIS